MVKSKESNLPTNGIQQKHLNEAFLLQRKNCPPSSACTIDRIYQDGSFYFYVNNSKSWALVTTLKENGLKELIKLLASQCNITKSPNSALSSMGTLEFIFNVDECSRKILIEGANYGQFSKLQNVSSLINSNLNPIKTE